MAAPVREVSTDLVCGIADVCGSLGWLLTIFLSPRKGEVVLPFSYSRKGRIDADLRDQAPVGTRALSALKRKEKKGLACLINMRKGVSSYYV